MKRLALILLLTLSSGMSFAGVTSASEIVLTPSTRTEVGFEQLPEAVQKTLDGARFTGWKPVIAYKVTSESSEYYEITFVRGDEIEHLLLNSQGGKIG